MVHGSFDTKKIAALLQPRCEFLGDIPEQVDFFDRLPEYENGLYANKKMKTTPESSLEVLQKVLPVLEGLADFSAEGIHAAMFGLIEELGVKNGAVLFPLRVAVSGKEFTPGGIELCEILGKEESCARIRKAVSQLQA